MLGVNVQSRYGGAEAGVVAYALAMLEIARACASTAVTMAVTNMVAEVIQTFGSEEQREEHVTKITSGEYVTGAFALSEPGAGSDAAALKTTATKNGDGWVIDGQKQWITNGAHAGVMVVWARTGGPGRQRHLVFLAGQGHAWADGRAGRGQDGASRLQHGALQLRRTVACRRVRCSAKKAWAFASR